MTPHQIVTACIRLVVLIWLLYVFDHLWELFKYADSDSQVHLDKSFIILIPSLQLAACAFLWFFPRTIAAKLLPGVQAVEVTSQSNLIQWQTLGVICIGLWELSKAIPDAVYWITFYDAVTTSAHIGFSSFNAGQKAAMISTAVEVVIGVLLLLGAKGIATIIFKLRTSGRGS